MSQEMHRLPIESQVAHLTCEETIRVSASDVLARYVARLVQQSKVPVTAVEMATTLMDSVVQHNSDGDELHRLWNQVRRICMRACV